MSTRSNTCFPGWRCNSRQCPLCLEVQAKRFLNHELGRIERELRERPASGDDPSLN